MERLCLNYGIWLVWCYSEVGCCGIRGRLCCNRWLYRIRLSVVAWGLY